MMPASTGKAEALGEPVLTVILPALLGYRTVAGALKTWDAQTLRDRLEILVLCPDAASVTPDPGHTLVRTESMLLHEARVAGIRQAQADFVMIAEDHCVPDRSFAEKILQRIQEGWEGVGPALQPGNQQPWALASFLLGYGEWVLPETGEVSILPGHNTIWRKQALLELGEELGEELLVASFLVRRLKQAGSRIFIDNQARMRHFDPPGLLFELRVFLHVGLTFGAVRTQKWRLPARFLYLFAAPAVAALHWRRCAKHYLRTRREMGTPIAVLFWAAVLAILWGVGESLGAVAGVDRVMPDAWITEIKPVSLEDVHRAEAAAGSGAAAFSGQKTGS